MREFARSARIFARTRDSRSDCGPTWQHRAAGRSAGGARLLRLPSHEVDEHVVTEILRRGEERTTPVDLGHLLDECAQRPVGAEHERVDADLLLRAAHDLAQRCLDRLARRRIVEERMPSGVMCAVGSPSVIMMICLVPDSLGQQLRASVKP